jgi:hypothetical protein
MPCSKDSDCKYNGFIHIQDVDTVVPQGMITGLRSGSEENVDVDTVAPKPVPGRQERQV